MADPAWFFSTLAQAIAAIIGFFIALATVIYQLDKVEKRRKTEDLRESYKEFKEYYLPHYRVMSFQVLSLIDERLPDQLAESDDLEERERELLEQDFDMPHTIYLWSLIRDINIKLKSIGPAAQPENHYLLTEDELEELEDRIGEINEFINEGTLGNDTPLLDEIEETHGLNWGDIMYGEELRNIFYDYETISEKFDVDIERETFDIYNNLSTIGSAPFILMLGVQGKKHEMSNTILDKDAWLEPFFKKSMVLVLIGVVLPICALIAPPIQILVLQGGALTVYQTFLVLGSMTVMGLLIRDIRDKME